MVTAFDSIPTLLKKACDKFQERFSHEPTVAVSAPGRVNLIGDHVDYNGGLVVPMALPMGIVAVGRLNNSDVCRIETDSESIDDPKYAEFNLPSDSEPLTSGEPKWLNYIKGVVANFHGQLKGFDCVFTTSLPVGAGLSSSAAIEVATYTLLEYLTNDVLPDVKKKALACQKAEHEFADVPCGIMDQFICTMAKKGSALLLDCKTQEGKFIPLDDPTVCVLIIDSGVKHHLSGSEYPQRRLQCEKVAKFFKKPFMREVSREELEGGRTVIDSQEYYRALHVVNETEYAQEFIKHIQNQNFKKAGQAMMHSHSSLSDLYNVSCKELDDLVEISSRTKGIYGSRMTGAGFGGCVVCLAKTAKAENAIEAIRSECQTKGLSPAFYICSPSDGVRRLDLPSQ